MTPEQRTAMTTAVVRGIVRDAADAVTLRHEQRKPYSWLERRLRAAIRRGVADVIALCDTIGGR